MDTSFWGLFWSAAPVVKSVMFILCAFSVWSWSTITLKTHALFRINLLSRTFEKTFWEEGVSLKALYATFARDPQEPFAVCFKAVLQELPPTFPQVKLSLRAKKELGERLEAALVILVTQEISTLKRNLAGLATLAPTSMFLGLFGTVWGIMESFQAIASAGDTSLVVVAPAISEALMATALGLFVAIPASFGYHMLSAAISRYHTRLGLFAKQMCFSFLSEIKEKESA